MGFELPRRANAQNSAPVITSLAAIAPMTPQPYAVNSFPYLMRGRSESITSSKVLSREKSATKRLAIAPNILSGRNDLSMRLVSAGFSRGYRPRQGCISSRPRVAGTFGSAGKVHAPSGRSQ